MLVEGLGSRDGGILYSNATIKQVYADAIGGVLRLKVLYDEREYLTYLYKDVFYSQIDEHSIGFRVTLAAEIAPEQLDISKYQLSAARLLSDCGHTSTAFLSELAQRGYRILMHYSQQSGERIVIARQVRTVANQP